MDGTGLYVLVHHRADPRQTDLLLDAYDQAVKRLTGTAGLLGTQLLVSEDDPSRYVLLMRWDGGETFRTWERRERELGHPSAMRQFQDRARPGGHYEIYTGLPETS